ncbi:hypothetical protein B7463_g6135, partial [Scytalidium lignicola]
MPPPLMETVTVINKSGKIISTGKSLINIFKEAKDAYQDKRAELKAEQRERLRQKYAQKHAQKYAQKLLLAREETQSVASSRHSRHSRSSHRSHREHRDRFVDPLPPLSEVNLSHQEEGHELEPQYSGSIHESYHGSAHSGERSPSIMYREPYVETEVAPHPGIMRRHTDFVEASSEMMPPDHYPPDAIPLYRSVSNPDFRDEVDMGLAYGELPPDLYPPFDPVEEEKELNSMVFKIENMLLEAQCLHHSATAIISSLQEKPDAMAAVALTLAELSSLLTKMSPSIISVLKGLSPAIFALLASPQFLIGSGVALGVTIIMFGGFKIIKKIQGTAVPDKEAVRMEGSFRPEQTMMLEQPMMTEQHMLEQPMMEQPMRMETRTLVEEPAPMEEAIIYEQELSAIECWRRGIADVEAVSVATSADGELITPEAERQRIEKIRERAREERKSTRAPSVMSSSTSRSHRHRTSSRVAQSESGRTERSVRSERSEKPRKESIEVLPKEKKSKNPLALLFKKDKSQIFGDKSQVERVQDTDSEKSHHRRRRKHHHHQPTIIEM